MSNITTIILTGGEATRMRPLSHNMAKTMIPFMGRPLLLNLVRLLAKAGCRDLIFSSAGKTGEIEKYFGDGCQHGVNIRYFRGASWRGTAGVVNFITREYAGALSEQLLIVYGDSLLRFDLLGMIEEHVRTRARCTILVHPADFGAFLYEPVGKEFGTGVGAKRTNYGVVYLASNGRILRIMEKPRLEEIDGQARPMANGAVYLFDRELLDYVSDGEGECDFPRDLFPLLLTAGIKCQGFDIGAGYRIDLGTIINYYRAQFSVLHGLIPFDSYFPEPENRHWIGRNSKVAVPAACGRPLLIGEECHIGRGAWLSNAVIGNHVTVESEAVVESSIVLDGTFIGSKARIKDSIIGEHCYIGEGIELPPGTVLGHYCRVADPACDLAGAREDFGDFAK